ncbi:hypothetical protein KW785_01795 [Candidatus Parcubacteria bacterium]|nr:hypothetical protein [Candidatus Parcubacteria bacterium]
MRKGGGVPPGRHGIEFEHKNRYKTDPDHIKVVIRNKPGEIYDIGRKVIHDGKQYYVVKKVVIPPEGYAPGEVSLHKPMQP